MVLKKNKAYMRTLLTILLALLITNSQAETMVLEIPNQGWSVKFDTRPVEKLKEISTENQYYYFGTSGRFSLSLTVETPTCVGEINADENLKCILGKVEKFPGLVKDSVITNPVKNGIKLSYIIYVPLGGSMIKAVNTHIVFAHNDRWGDLHISTIKPTPEELAQHLTLADHFEYYQK